MEHSEYSKVYEGNSILVSRIKNALETEGIVPIVKDEGESQLMAGFGSSIQGFQELYVNDEELEQAETIVNRLKAEMER